jgi:hypothetical protein
MDKNSIAVLDPGETAGAVELALKRAFSTYPNGKRYLTEEQLSAVIDIPAATLTTMRRTTMVRLFDKLLSRQLTVYPNRREFHTSRKHKASQGVIPTLIRKGFHGRKRHRRTQERAIPDGPILAMRKTRRWPRFQVSGNGAFFFSNK